MPNSLQTGDFGDASSGPSDPFDLDALRTEGLHEIDVVKLLTTVPVKKPNRSEFIRVHPGADYVIDAYVLERESDRERAVYWVAPAMRGVLAEEVKAVRLFTCVNKHGVVFLWPAKIPTSGSNMGRAWHESALEAAEQAKGLWVRVMGNRNLGAYEIFTARGDLGEPEWPDKSFRELIRLGFGDYIIDSPDHPVARELRGEI